MISYKYKLYKTKRFKHLDKMLAEACFIWNHALALQKRHYRLYHKYIPLNVMQAHQAKRIKRYYLSSKSVQELLERLDRAYIRFFKHISSRPPKYKKTKNFGSIVFKGRINHGKPGVEYCVLNDNTISIGKTKETSKIFKFYKSRDYEGNIKRVVIKRNKLYDYYLYIITDFVQKKHGKTLKGASVGIDFGLRTYLTLSDGTKYNHPQFMVKEINELRRRQRKYDKSVIGSNNRERKRKDLNRLSLSNTNKRNDFQWKLAHELCRKYDQIFIENLKMKEMKLCHKANRKLKAYAHFLFTQKLEYVATKYGVTVHKIDRYYPSSKMCTCGYINKGLKLSERYWSCPKCGTIHNRDLLAANNILRRGIAELESGSKTLKYSVISSHESIQQSSEKLEYAKTTTSV